MFSTFKLERRIIIDTTMSRVRLVELFDASIREVTQKETGICLYQGGVPPEEELFTVYSVFERGFNSSLSMCAEKALLTQITQAMMRETEVTQRDIEDFSKEYFNILCGHIVTRLFKMTKIAARFSVPSFHTGRYDPDDQLEHLIINYASDTGGGLQLIHRTRN